MNEPWRCPECLTWIRADVTEHRCNPGDGTTGVTVTPWTPPGGGSISITAPPPEGVVLYQTNATSTTTVTPNLWSVGSAA